MCRPSGNMDWKNADLYCITTDALENLPDFHIQVEGGIPIVMLCVTFSHDILQRLSLIPSGTEALLVNLNEPMAQEAVTKLIQLGASHINTLPFIRGRPQNWQREYSMQSHRMRPGMCRRVSPIS